MRCPQCSSKRCGPIVCRFSGMSHARRREQDAINAYANGMSARDVAQRHEGAPEHDMTAGGEPLKPGR